MIHLIAIAGRLGVKLGIDDFERLASELPCLVNLQPSGKHLMEDFCYAGGLPVVMKEIAHLLHLDAVTANGKTVGDNIDDAENFNTDVIKPFDAPFKAKAGIAVLRGNLAPRGAIIKPSAATPALMKHRGRAVVFDTIEEFHARIDDESLDIDETCIMVLRNCGPKGYPGMAEVGNMPLPPKVLKKGITDMVRISDARMSGTAYGTVVLHTAPEAADGGPLAAVRSGDFIELDVAEPAPPPRHQRRRAGRAHEGLAARPRRRSRAATGSSTSTTCCRPTRAPTSTSSSASAARSCRATTTERTPPRSRGRAVADDSIDGRALQAVPDSSDLPARTAFHHRRVINRKETHDVIETQDPHRPRRCVGDDLGVRCRRVLHRRPRRRRRRRATRWSPRRAPATSGHPVTGTIAAIATSGSTATGSALATATSTTRRSGSRTASHWRLHHSAWSRARP